MMYQPSAPQLSIHLGYGPSFPDASAAMPSVSTATPTSSLPLTGFSDRSELIQIVCQIYETVEGERVCSRKTALIRRGSSLHPYSVCNPNYGGHEQCLPMTVDYVSSDFAPPTMAHHYYYLHIHGAPIRDFLKDELYRELYHTPPKDLIAKYAQFRNRFNLGPLQECRVLMFTVLSFWIQRCRVLKQCLVATELFPVRLEWIDPIFQGTKFKPDIRSRSWECGREIDEYGWAVEMLRAERTLAFTENCPLIFLGDNTSARLSRYVDWGKRLSDFDGRFQRQFDGNDVKWKEFDEYERLSILVHRLQKVHFGNGCVAVVITSGAPELAEGMPAAKYVELLQVLLAYLLQFQLRILVAPPTPNKNVPQLWYRYLKQQHELSNRLTTVEFLIAPSQHRTDGRSFLDALLIGNRAMDPSVCDDAGFTDFGIKKLGFFLVEVMQIPKTLSGGDTQMASRRRERQFGAAETAKPMPELGVVNFDNRNIANMRLLQQQQQQQQQSVGHMEVQAPDWYPPSLEYEPIDDIAPRQIFPAGLPSNELLPADLTYLNAKSYSELAGNSLNTGAQAQIATTRNQNPRYPRKKKKRNKNNEMSGMQHPQAEAGQVDKRQQQFDVESGVTIQKQQTSSLTHVKPKNYFTHAQERRIRRKRARLRRNAEQTSN